MQAIQVKVLPATNTKPTRIKAWSYSGLSVTRSRTYCSEISDDMRDAARELAQRLQWTGEFRGGTLPNGEMVWVCGEYDGFMILESEL